MVAKKGKYYFGFGDGVYGSPTDAYEDFKQYKNTIDKESVIKHIESLDDWLMCGACGFATDLFTGEQFNAGIYCDGDFVFSVDFFRYYKTQDIGIPYEYEEYLKQKLQIE